MMRIGVVSDTHGNRSVLEALVKRLGRIDWLIHAGDTFADAEYLASRMGVPFQAVPGNCEFPGGHPYELCFELEGQSFFLAHGHQYMINSSDQVITAKAKAKGADIVIVGHTHQGDFYRYEGLLLMNPGSPFRPRGDSFASFGIIGIQSGKVTAELVELRW